MSLYLSSLQIQSWLFHLFSVLMLWLLFIAKEKETSNLDEQLPMLLAHGLFVPRVAHRRLVPLASGKRAGVQVYPR